MELEDINYLIGNTNRNNVTQLNLLSREPTFLLSYELDLLKNLKGFDTSLNQLVSLPSDLSDLKSFTLLNNNSNYSDEMME
jgi:hypothetical protein